MKLFKWLLPIVITLPTAVVGYEVFNTISKHKSDIEDVNWNGELILSTDPSKVNMINVFVDGLDPAWIQDEIKSNDGIKTKLKDFTFYPNFLVNGENTNQSKPSLLAGTTDFSPLPKLLNGEETKLFNLDWFKEAYKKRTSIIKSKNFSQYTFAPLDVVTDTTGDGFYTRPKIAKDYIGGAIVSMDTMAKSYWKDNSYIRKAQHVYAFDYINKSIKASSNVSNQPFVDIEITDLHPPYLFDDNFNISNLQTGNMVETYKRMQAQLLDNFGKFLGQIPKDIYDNSRIVIYGDHNSHTYVPNGGVKNNNSALLIKEPNTTKSSLSIEWETLIQGKDLISIETGDIKPKDINNSYAFTVIDGKYKKITLNPTTPNHELVTWDELNEISNGLSEKHQGVAYD